MLSIALRAKADRMTYGVAPHRAFFDLPGREVDGRRNDTEVDLHEDVAISPLVAKLNDMPAQDSIPDLRRVLDKLRKQRPDRTDGTELAALLLSWAEQFRDGWWDVSGNALTVLASRGKGGIDLDGEHRERYSDRSVTTFDRHAPGLGIGEAMEDRSHHDSGNEIDQRMLTHKVGEDGHFEKRPIHGGGGASGRVRKDAKPSTADRNAKQRAALQEDGLTRPAFVGARVSEDVKRRLVDERDALTPTAGQILELVGTALLSGRTWDDVKRELAKEDVA